ncbi:uncharacterized protein B0H18DRAFT_1209503 [Fomitopsis serialis]|uniref:uncharacterized protein n=1 Tax=Fomitopsis serialis TaxID=139415 RepID=UPI0020077AE7|nr:uncharacterized protein B0H18DRAFT_1209503 [Neoantrodia serialis]KAH9929986.1 hypothetical protein B0H18DRAFT_1209503 [Neoantrodia serialis]
MASREGKRRTEARDGGRRRYRSDGTPIWGQRVIDGPGVWVTCIKGREKQTVGELYDLFDSLASELWQEEGAKAGNGETDSDNGGDDEEELEKQIAKEVASMKRPRKEQRFVNCQTNTPCVVFISCKPPVDPVQMVVKHVQNVVDAGVTQTRYVLFCIRTPSSFVMLSRYTQRLTPVSGTCVANLSEVQSLCKRIVVPFFEDDPEKIYRYKIELRMRNHNTMSRSTLIEGLAKCIPERHQVNLDNAEAFILVEVFKSICGLSVVKDYYSLHKFNVMEIAHAKNSDAPEDGRMADSSSTVKDATE